MKKFYLESYGCSLNKADSQAIKALLKEEGFTEARPEKAGIIIINACAVKEHTENRMIKRIRELMQAKERNARLIVFGCLAKINPERVKAISGKIILIEPSLKKLSDFLKIKRKEFSPLLAQCRENKIISIIPIARGCLSACAYCAVKKARGPLKSYPVKEIKKAFEREVKESMEIWITAQDCGCYGFDLGTSLPALIKELLKTKGNYRVRVGMINPQHLKKFFPSYIKLFKDERLYRFFHIPVQSGSNRILKLMNRNYNAEEFIELVKRIRGKFPRATIATDVIAGFPSETEKEFNETLQLIKKLKPDIVNISRFGIRPDTQAEKMEGQIHGRIKKERSRILSLLCRKIALEQNKKFIGRIEECLVSEKGAKKGFIARTSSYKPVVIQDNLLGEFVKLKITEAKPTYLVGTVL
ncbi:MAG: tRNA (N(6)-L-threonylcarbamoyladenosine(37)-C(2))-methylthiotransferase [Candidatus Diapherotrites archaeon]